MSVGSSDVACRAAATNFKVDALSLSMRLSVIVAVVGGADWVGRRCAVEMVRGSAAVRWEVFLVEVGGVGRRARVVEWVGMSFSEGQQAMPVES